MDEDERNQHGFQLNRVSGFSLAFNIMLHIFIYIFNLFSQAFKRCSAYRYVFYIVIKLHFILTKLKFLWLWRDTKFNLFM